ncbi:MAG: prepilin-type N-terminal cleavage/methylation domain-containing protein [Verrucomicrobia bacterium]|nr:prepilin-type N-terminal cleavage/methylation domain-containing protein [Verrucomicrobiota bacterium]
MKSPRARRQGGFTLVEVITAAAVSLILTVAILRIFVSLSTSTSQADQRVDAYREARAALNLIQRDLANLVVAPATGPYLALYDRSFGYPAANNNNRGGEEIYFLHSRRESATTSTGPTPTPGPNVGDLSAVGYYCAWDAGKGAFELRRFFREQQATYEALRTSFNESKTNGDSPPLARLSALYVPDKANDDVLASYVWDLRIRALAADGSEIQFQSKSYPLVWNEKDFQPPPNTPVTIEISFKALSPLAAGRLKALKLGPSDWMGARDPNVREDSNYFKHIRPLVYEFRTSFRISQNR